MLVLCEDFRVFHTDSTSKRRILVSMSQSLAWFKGKKKREKKRKILFEAKELWKKWEWAKQNAIKFMK